MASRNLLMIPGPSEVDPDVLSLMSTPVVPHYGREWGETYRETLELCKEVFGTEGEALILPTPGQLALETAIVSLVPRGEGVVTAVNGHFGEVVSETVEYCGRRSLSVRAGPGEPVDSRMVREKLRGEEGVAAVAVVHCETSTGVVNPVEEIAEVAREEGATVIVDAISSYGGMPVRMDEWGIDLCVGYAGKCLSSVNGITPVAVARDVWEELGEPRMDGGRMTDLRVWKDFAERWGKWGHPYPCTQPTQNIRALLLAIQKARGEGLERRYERHDKMARAFRRAVEAIDLGSLPQESDASATVSVLEVPGGHADGVRRTLAREFGIMVSGGLEGLSGRVIRVGHMGVTANPRYLAPTVSAIERACVKVGLRDNPGVALVEFYGSLQSDGPVS